ncbi:TlpA family protein disulfide reductase [Clavibacter michiganensis]|uniref:TlpA family protein disulfide reductase n=1 Tax=Clavibacter michiganensis TaxID=28447 RepID=UPI00345BEA83
MVLRPASLLAGALVLVAALSGCTASDDLAQQFRSGDGKGYISGDGRVTESSVEDRGEPVTFASDDTAGTTVTAEQFRGKVLVVNFWYAECGPCRLEAKDLNKVSEATTDTAAFLGVNTRDSAANADAFVRTFGVPYDTVLDVEDNSVQLAFADRTAPNATPSTIVLDPEGRVSARILGLVDPSTLTTLIATAAATPPA